MNRDRGGGAAAAGLGAGAGAAAGAGAGAAGGMGGMNPAALEALMNNPQMAAVRQVSRDFHSFQSGLSADSIKPCSKTLR